MMIGIMLDDHICYVIKDLPREWQVPILRHLEKELSKKIDKLKTKSKSFSGKK